MSEHTPGPWETTEIRGTPHGHIGVYRCIQSDGDLIAHTWPYADPNESANARLIAASPNLLTACEVAAQWFHNVTPCREFEQIRSSPDLALSMKMVVEGFRAAIAKARGPQPSAEECELQGMNGLARLAGRDAEFRPEVTG